MRLSCVRQVFNKCNLDQNDLGLEIQCFSIQDQATLNAFSGRDVCGPNVKSFKSITSIISILKCNYSSVLYDSTIDPRLTANKRD